VRDEIETIETAMTLDATDVQAAELLEGVVLVTVPHMDDAVLACGGTLAQLSDTSRVHVVYASDGRRSPEPLFPWSDRVDVDLFSIRKQEARTALDRLGVPQGHIHFLGLPDCRIARHRGELEAGLADLSAEIRPDRILTPFRFDRHPDHVALNRAVIRRLGGADRAPLILEYFVYHHWRLLREGDVRAYLRPGLLKRVIISSVSELKRSVLESFRSQTTRYFDWQTRPNLTAQLLDEVSRSPEYYLPFDPDRAGARVFSRSTAWIRIAHRLEPALKKQKDRVVAVARRGLRGTA
jgi:LmbE family N-acetylglucosaminyl deacetylase